MKTFLLSIAMLAVLALLGVVCAVTGGWAVMNFQNFVQAVIQVVAFALALALVLTFAALVRGAL